MSYILDALNKSQRERELGQVPTLADTPHLSPGGTGRGRHWGIAALVLALFATLIALYGVFGERWTSSPAALQPPTQTQAPTAKEATQPIAAPPRPASTGPAALPDPAPAAPMVTAANTSPPSPNPPQPNPRQAEPSERVLATRPAKASGRTGSRQEPKPAAVPVPARRPLEADIEVPPDLLEDVQRFEERLRREQKLATVEDEEIAPKPIEEPIEEPVDGPVEEPVEGEVEGAAAAMEEVAPEPDAATPESPPITAPEAKSPPPDVPQTRASSLPGIDAPSTGLTEPSDEIRLTVHVYSATPEQRFVIVNSRKMREGERSPKGLLVEEITPDGVHIQYQGQRFFQPR